VFIIDIHELVAGVDWSLAEVSGGDDVWVALKRRRADMEDGNHLFAEDRVALRGHEEERDGQHLLFAQVRHLNLDLHVHQAPALGDFLELELAEGAVGVPVVGADHRGRVPRDLRQVADFELKRPPASRQHFFVELVLRVPCVL